MHPNTHVKARRRRDGQALVEGVVALVLLIAGTVGATLLLTNVGLGLFYKEKLAFCGNQAAQFAYSLRTNPNVEAETTTFVSELLPKLGVIPNQLSVKVDPNFTLAGRPAVSVTISNACNLFGDGSILPAKATLTDFAAAASSSTTGTAAAASGYLEVPRWAGGEPILVPIAGSLPADYTTFRQHNPTFQLRLPSGPLQVPGGAWGDFSALPPVSP
jgi:hypothetical protein